MQSAILTHHAKKDLWYKEPWLLLVIGGPLIVVVASLFTGYLALHGADQVVAKDYYRQGLMINTNLQRDVKARQLELEANLQFNFAAQKITMTLGSKQISPDTIQLSLASSGMQSGSVEEVIHRLAFRQIETGKYEANLAEVSNLAKRLNLQSIKLLHVKIETNEWRLTGDWYDPMQRNVRLVPTK